tara:strand:- start:460 stop:654 length:195 start_codon:yes stop_codon:yes gene_type:complete
MNYIDLLPDDLIEKIYKIDHQDKMNETLLGIEYLISDITLTIVSKRRWKRKFKKVLKDIKFTYT